MGQRTQAVTILSCDLVASTERRARLGDDAFDDFTTRFMTTLRAAITEADGRVVSSAGDGLMVVFPASIADIIRPPSPPTATLRQCNSAATGM